MGWVLDRRDSSRIVSDKEDVLHRREIMMIQTEQEEGRRERKCYSRKRRGRLHCIVIVALDCTLIDISNFENEETFVCLRSRAETRRDAAKQVGVLRLVCCPDWCP